MLGGDDLFGFDSFISSHTSRLGLAKCANLTFKLVNSAKLRSI